MLDISFILGFIGAAIGLIIGILVFSEIENSIDCPDSATNSTGAEACTKAKSISWTVVAIFPITLFFSLFAIFGGFSKGIMG
ncbi:MAG: hypothetical protein CMI54_08045 [Parcubacteria group bacterium]|jgi:ABC-type lipoprotein release transport system permease subunit|nr:hypothetical protein [Parcubacteria group bacterium]|tara:strand:+ start:95 stop:340 length:246 start_codon:yes stop_codon:yes gene_type:complete